MYFDVVPPKRPPAEAQGGAGLAIAALPFVLAIVAFAVLGITKRYRRA